MLARIGLAAGVFALVLVGSPADAATGPNISCPYSAADLSRAFGLAFVEDTGGEDDIPCDYEARAGGDRVASVLAVKAPYSRADGSDPEDTRELTAAFRSGDPCKYAVEKDQIGWGTDAEALRSTRTIARYDDGFACFSDQVEEDPSNPRSVGVIAYRGLPYRETGTLTVVAAGMPRTAPPMSYAVFQSRFLRLVGDDAFGADAPSVLSSLKTISDITGRDVAVASGATAVLGLVTILPSTLLGSAATALMDRLAARRARRREALGATAREPRRIRWWHAAVAVVIAAVISGFVEPDFGFNAGSARTAGSIVAGFAVEVVLGWTVVSWLTRRAVPGAVKEYAVKPWSLLIVAGAVLFVRLTDFAPGIVFGLVAGVSFGALTTVAEKGRESFVPLAYGFVLALLAWIGFSVLGVQDSAAGLFASETLATITIAGLAALPLLLLPVAGMPGEKVAAWSKKIWVPSYLLGLLAFFVVVMPMPTSWQEIDGPLGVWIGLYAVYLVVALVGWFVLVRNAPAPDTTVTDLAEPVEAPDPS